MPSPGRRAAPLPPEQRRARLAAAALELIRDHGTRVSTKQLAEAAGVAEGTIFRVFATKEDLVDEAVRIAFDPAPSVAALSAIDPAAPLEERLRLIVRSLRSRLEGLFQLMAVLELQRPPHRLHSPILERVADLLRPDAPRLRCEPEEVAHLLRLLVFAGSHPVIGHGQRLSNDQIVDVLLHGICVEGLQAAGLASGG